MPDATDKKKISRMFPNQVVKEPAGTRGPDGTDDTTCFGIPGSGLPRRHCNTDFKVTLAVCTDMSVFMSVHDGKIYQNVYGVPYHCKLFSCPHEFNLYIPKGASGWEGVQFSHKNGIRCDGDVACVSEGRVRKTYDRSVPFEWVFGPCTQLQEKEEYYVSDIQKTMPYRVDQNGGYSESDSAFVYMGLLTDYNWKQEMGSSQDGHIYLCGGIIYDNGAVVTSDISAKATELVIPGLNLASFYYPGAILKDGIWMSLNRAEGYFKICNPSRSAEYLDQTGVWRDVKNTENDRAVEEGFCENWGFRLHDGTSWERLLLIGEGGEADEDDIEGIGSDGPGGSGSGGCCCM